MSVPSHPPGNFRKSSKAFHSVFSWTTKTRSTINSDNEISYPARCIQLGLPFLLNRINFLSISFVIKYLYNCFDIDVHR